MDVKPPVGIMPYKVWIDKRIATLHSALVRYNEAGMVVPPEWLTELKLHTQGK
jgi:hypothetical protein